METNIFSMDMFFICLFLISLSPTILLQAWPPKHILPERTLFLPLKVVHGLLIGQVFLARSSINLRPIRCALVKVCVLFLVFCHSRRALCKRILGDTARDVV